MPHFSNNLPYSTIGSDILSSLPKLDLDDPHFYRSFKIDILLGADLLPFVMLSGCRRAICGSLFTQETVFGWILTGPIPTKAPKSFFTCLSYFCEISLEKSFLKFWEMETIPQQRVMSKTDRHCDENYQRTTTGDENGR